MIYITFPLKLPAYEQQTLVFLFYRKPLR